MKVRELKLQHEIELKQTHLVRVRYGSFSRFMPFLQSTVHCNKMASKQTGLCRYMLQHANNDVKMLEKLAKELRHESGSNVPGMEHCFRCKDGIDFNVPRPQARHSWPLCQLRMADTRSRQARMATMHLTPAHGCSLMGWICKR